MNSAELDQKIRDCAKQTIVVLRKRGYCKGRYQGSKGDLCLYGAMAVASHLPPGSIDGLHTYVADRIVNILGINRLSPTWIATWQSLTMWNDDPKRTVDDLIAILEKVVTASVVSIIPSTPVGSTTSSSDR